MTKKFFPVGVAIALILGLAGCDISGGGTGVKGELILEPGQSCGVHDARVELYEEENISGTPVKYLQLSGEGTDQTEAEFKIEDVLAAYYYLPDWKDTDGDVKNHLGDDLQRGAVREASGTIADAGYSVYWTYSYNEGVALETFTVTIPGYDSYTDPNETGSWNGDQSCASDKYIIGGGTVPIPGGTHTSNFAGEFGGADFDFTVVSF